jgi:predicted RNase H-like nuclease (RuvC/YqgF family)
MNLFQHYQSKIVQLRDENQKLKDALIAERAKQQKSDGKPTEKISCGGRETYRCVPIVDTSKRFRELERLLYNERDKIGLLDSKCARLCNERDEFKRLLHIANEKLANTNVRFSTEQLEHSKKSRELAKKDDEVNDLQTKLDVSETLVEQLRGNGKSWIKKEVAAFCDRMKCMADEY